MCGRFTVTNKDTKTIADRFQVELEKALERGGDGEAPPPGEGAGEEVEKGLDRFNVAPTQEILIVRSSPDPEEAEQGEREARLMRWGLVPRWAKDLKVGYRMINAKAENLTNSRAYGPLVGKFRHRCLIVADGFYEWMKAEDPKQPRQPWRFTVDGGEPFAFAGICTRKEWEDEEDRGFDDGWLYSATIVTTTPNEVVDPVHNRMPAILPSAEAEAAWLRPDLSAEDAVAMCGPLDPGRMAGAPANPELNKVGKGMAEGPELLVAPQSRLSPIPALLLRPSSASSVLLLRLFFGFVFGFFVDRRRDLLQPALGLTVALPALVVSVQETFAAGRRSCSRSCRRAVRGPFSASPAMKYSRCSVPTSYSGHSSLTPFSVVNRIGRSSASSDDVFAAAGAEVDQQRFRHFLAVDAGFRGARVERPQPAGGLGDFGPLAASIEQRMRASPTGAPASICRVVATRKSE